MAIIKIRCILPVILLFYSIPAFSSLGLDILKIDFGSRAVSMGGAYTAAEGDNSMMFWNPAGLSSLHKREIMVMHRSWILNSYYEGTSFTQDLKRIGVLGAGLLFFIGPTSEEVDISGFPTGVKLTSSSYVFLLSLSRELFWGVSGGVNGKYVHEDIAGFKRGFIFYDAGLQRLLYETPSDSVKLGITLQNADPLSQITGESSPMTIKAGAVYTAYDNFKLNFDINKQMNSIFRFNLGAEYVILKWFAFRAGYKLNSDLEGVTIGLGMRSGFLLRQPDITLDYAVTSFGTIGLTHNISVRMML